SQIGMFTSGVDQFKRLCSIDLRHLQGKYQKNKGDKYTVYFLVINEGDIFQKHPKAGYNVDIIAIRMPVQFVFQKIPLRYPASLLTHLLAYLDSSAVRLARMLIYRHPSVDQPRPPYQ